MGGQLGPSLVRAVKDPHLQGSRAGERGLWGRWGACRVSWQSPQESQASFSICPRGALTSGPGRGATASNPLTSCFPTSLLVPVWAARCTPAASQDDVCVGLSPTENPSFFLPAFPWKRNPQPATGDFRLVESPLKTSSCHSFVLKSLTHRKKHTSLHTKQVSRSRTCFPTCNAH